jgi:hypothetical protein
MNHYLHTFSLENLKSVVDYIINETHHGLAL